MTYVSRESYLKGPSSHNFVFEIAHVTSIVLMVVLIVRIQFVSVEKNPSSQNKDNLETCQIDKSIDLGQCIIDCNSDQAYETSCVDRFKEEFEECPCQVSSSTSWPEIIIFQKCVFRTNVRSVVHVTDLIANRTKNQYWS